MRCTKDIGLHSGSNVCTNFNVVWIPTRDPDSGLSERLEGIYSEILSRQSENGDLLTGITCVVVFRVYKFKKRSPREDLSLLSSSRDYPNRES